MNFNFRESVTNVAVELFVAILIAILRSKMILKFFLIFHAIFALKGRNRNSNRDIGSFLEQVNTNESFVEPKFNENCDEVSLEAAYECEAEFKIS